MIAHRRLAQWYDQMARHLEAGVTLPDSVRLSSGPSAKDRLRLAADLETTDPRACLRDPPRWLPTEDGRVLCSALETGRLPETFQILADRRRQIGATQLKVILGGLYPLIVFHVAAALLPLIRMIDFETGFEWDSRAYGLHVGLLLLPVWLIGLIIYLLATTRNPLLPGLLRCVPLLRAYSRAQSLADFSHVLGALVAAGVPAPKAWDLASRSVQDPRFRRATERLASTFAAGGDPSPMLDRLGCFPSSFVACYSSGARTGKLDASLLSAAKMYQDEANRAMTLAAIAYPVVLFAFTAAIVVLSIFRIYAHYLDAFTRFGTV